ncbi:MAG: uroporphyrinogen-III C-methyltransferase, partial [Nitrososphaera sp.]|uniref:uroporphyrinogen-III C-methyltransferase n=1 Tax=Nitrososphaera sp. TaxID=1971748 RepID=UPI003D6F607D
GPGDAGLMTVRAMELVRSCDVILYDRLVGQGIVDQMPAGTEKVYVGRAVGDPTTHQKRTNELMVQHAKKGKSVLRLKGGDPFIYGRGAEEAEYLLEHGIEFEIVPGITSAIASPAYAGIPLTHRQHSSSVAIVTGHEGEDNKGETSVNWKKLPGAVDTIVVLMGIGQLEQISRDLIKGGMKKTTKVAIVESGTTDRQRVVTGTLAGAARLAARNNVRPPAIVVIGKVASLHEKIGWFKGGKSSGPV